METKQTLEQRLREVFPDLTDEDFGHHATDLYVKWRSDVVAWLNKNYQFARNIRTFSSQTSEIPRDLQAIGVREVWLDIPFAGNWKE